MFHRRAGAGAARIGDWIYIVGGVENGNVTTTSAERFNVTTETWEEIASMSEPRTDFALAALDGKLYAVSGDISGSKTFTRGVEEYDPACDKWISLPPVGSARCFCSATTLVLPLTQSFVSLDPASYQSLEGDGSEGGEEERAEVDWFVESIRRTESDGGTMAEINFDDIMFGANSEIGKGAFGTVHKAKWRGIDCAVKLLNSDQLTPSQLADFSDEVEIMSRVTNHPRIVRFLGACLQPPSPAIVLQYLPSGSVEDLLVKRQTHVSWPVLVRMMTDAALGVFHLHCEGVIHRDLATRNLLVDEHFHAYVSDFGMSRLRDYDEANSAQQTKSDVGPLKWMAPECIRDKVYSVKSDTWAFGVTLWEAFSQSVPFAHLDAVSAAMKIVYEGQRLELPKWAPEKLRAILAVCWKDQPEDRPTMDNIATLLEELIDLEDPRR